MARTKLSHLSDRCQPELTNVEECVSIERELYLGAVIDRTTRRIVFMASTEGGVEIEKVASETPEKILKATIDHFGPLSYQEEI